MMTVKDLTDPALLVPMKVKVLRPFCFRGERVEIGSIVEQPFDVARDAAAIGKARLLQPEAKKETRPHSPGLANNHPGCR